MAINLYFSHQFEELPAAHTRNVLCVTPSWSAVFLADSRTSLHFLNTASNASGRSISPRPNFTPRAFAAAIPSACRWRRSSRSVCATLGKKLEDYISNQRSCEVTPLACVRRGISSTIIAVCFSFVINRHCSMISSLFYPSRSDDKGIVRLYFCMSHLHPGLKILSRLFVYEHRLWGMPNSRIAIFCLSSF